MSTFKTFEDIEAWQKARSLAHSIHELTIGDPFAKDYKLVNQINGSAGSIMDNIAEGFERDGTREFIQFLSIAKGSSGETRSQLYRALDRNYISSEQFKELFDKSLQISKQLSKLMSYLKKSEIKGRKFQEPEENY